jgi:hypothetical protein
VFNRGLAIAVVVVCAVLELRALADRNGEPSNGGVRRFVMGEIAGATTVVQSFSPRADGLSTVTVYPRSFRQEAMGEATIELRDVTSATPVVVGRRSVPAGSIAESEALSLSFSPQQSRDRQYELALGMTGTPGGRGIGLLATRGEGNTPGALRVNGRRRYADLVFETSVRGAQSNYAVLASRLSGAGVPAAGVCLALAIALGDMSLLVLLLLLVHSVETHGS